MTKADYYHTFVCGDVHPAIALEAWDLKRGHDVAIAVNEFYRSKIS